MQVHLVCYSTQQYFLGKMLLITSAKKYGVDKVHSYSPKDLKKSDFFIRNHKIFENKKGAGYWLWKPYLIFKTLQTIPENDILIYSDCGVEIISNLSPLIAISNQNDILLFQDGGQHINRQYIKRDCLILMKCDSDKYLNEVQVQASFQLYKNTKSSRDFVLEWLRCCENKNLLNDSASVLGADYPEFVEHRHDQAILSLLSIRREIEVRRDPSQWGNHRKIKRYRKNGEFIWKAYSDSQSNSAYPTILYHHRMKNIALIKYFLNRIKNNLNIKFKNIH